MKGFGEVFGKFSGGLGDIFGDILNAFWEVFGRFLEGKTYKNLTYYVLTIFLNII